MRGDIDMRSKYESFQQSLEENKKILSNFNRIFFWIQHSVYFLKKKISLEKNFMIKLIVESKYRAC